MVTASSEWMVDLWADYEPTSPLTVQERSVAPLPLPAQTRFALSALPPEYVPVADAVHAMKLGEPEDAVTAAGVRAALDDPRCTALGKQAFAALLELMVDIVSRAPTAMVARLEVPTPGEHTTLLANDGPAELSVRTRIKLTEQRRRPSTFTERTSERPLIVEFALVRQTTIEIDVPDACSAILVSQTSDHEQCYGPGTSLVMSPPGSYRLEVWSDDSIVDAKLITLPELPRHARIDLSAYAGYQLIAEGRPLHRNPVAGFAQRGRDGAPFGYSCAFSYDEIPRSHAVPANVLDGVTTPSFDLPAGRYRATSAAGPDILLDLLSTGAVRATVAGTTFGLTPRINGRFQSDTEPVLVFEPDHRRLVLRTPERRVVYQLTPFDRIG